MKNWFVFIGLGLVVMLTGCRSTAPVQHTIEKTDSTKTEISKEHIKTDSSFFKQEVKEKKLPEANATLVATRNKVDSLLDVLDHLPKGTVVYLSDKKARAQLSFYKDSLNQVHINCKSAEQTYYENTITQGRFISQLEKEKSFYLHTIKLHEETIRQIQQKWYVKAGNFITRKVTAFFLLAIILFGLVAYLRWKKIL